MIYSSKDETRIDSFEWHDDQLIEDFDGNPRFLLEFISSNLAEKTISKNGKLSHAVNRLIQV